MLYIYILYCNNIIIYSSVSREHPFFDDFEAGDDHSVNSEDFFEGPLVGRGGGRLLALRDKNG